MHREGVQLEKCWNRGTHSRVMLVCFIAFPLLEWKALTQELAILWNPVHHWHSYHPVAMPTALKSSLSWHNAWCVSPPPPSPPPPPLPRSHHGRGYSVSTLCVPALHHSLWSLTSFCSSLTCVGPHQCCVAERVSAHINPSPPLTLCIGKGWGVDKERMRRCETVWFCSP